MDSRGETGATNHPNETQRPTLRRWNWIVKRLPPGASARLLRLHRLDCALVGVFVVSVFIIIRQLSALTLWLTATRIRGSFGDWSMTRWDAWDWVLLVGALLAAAGALLAGRLLSNRVVRQLEPDGWTGDPLFVKVALLDRDDAQHLQREAADAAEQARFDEESSHAPSWWARELLGAHLVWWVALAVVLANQQWHLLSPRLMMIVVWPILSFGILAKVVVGWVGYLFVPRTLSTRRALVRYYRWWAAGWVPAALALAGPPALMWLLTVVPGG